MQAKIDSYKIQPPGYVLCLLKDAWGKIFLAGTY